MIFLSIQALLTIKLYKHFIINYLHCYYWQQLFLPFVDQLFNGFSAPQKRWHFILAFNSSILIGKNILKQFDQRLIFILI